MAGRRKHQDKVQEALANDNWEAVEKLLSVRQKRFAEEYLVDFNASAAVLRAGYNSKHANKYGAELMANAAVKAYLDKLLKERADKSVVQPDYVIRKVVRTIEKAEQSANHSAVLKGCELLARHLGMFIDKTEITGKDGGAIEIAMQKAQEEAEALLNTLKKLANREEKKDIELV